MKKIVFVVLFATVASSSFAKEVVITQKDKKFSTAKLEVGLGDTLIFKNDEKDITHNIYSLTPGNEFDLKTQRPGEKTVLDLKKHKPGKMTVECAIHPDMKLEVEIK